MAAVETAPVFQPRLPSVPAAGPPTLAEDLLHPRHRQERTGAESVKDLVGREVRMLYPQGRDADGRHRAPIEGPADLALDGAALCGGGPAGSHEFFGAGGTERMWGAGGGGAARSTAHEPLPNAMGYSRALSRSLRLFDCRMSKD